MPAASLLDRLKVLIMTDSPLARLFADRKIRVRGDALNPLLCAKDVAESIGDPSYKRILGTFKSDKYAVLAVIPGEKISARVKFFTERGVYKYLMQTKCQKAAEFQEFVFDLLTAERQRVVDEIQLQAKIKQDEQHLRNEVLQLENKELKSENKELKGSVQFYKQSLRTSDWMLTQQAVISEEAFRRPDAYWTDLAKYYAERVNAELENDDLVPTDGALMDPRLQNIARDCFKEPTMWYDGYAIFLKKAQEIEKEQRRGGKKERMIQDSEIDWELFDQNLKIVRESRMRQEAEARR